MAKVRIYSEMCKLFRYFLGKMLTFRQKIRVTAVTQPLLTLNLIL